eukprot:3045504-Lingulodinium_polyedra.AAC.1
MPRAGRSRERCPGAGRWNSGAAGEAAGVGTRRTAAMPAWARRRSAQASGGSTRRAAGVHGLAPPEDRSEVRATSAAWSESP